MIQKGSRRIDITNGDNEPYENSVRAFVSQDEFKKVYFGLCENLTKRSIYKFDIDKDKFIEDCVWEINDYLRFFRAKNEYKIETGKAGFNDAQMFVMEDAVYKVGGMDVEIDATPKSDFEIANYIMHHTMLPRLAIFKILMKIEKRELLNNQDVLDSITQKILKKLNDIKAENISSYEVIDGYELKVGDIFARRRFPRSMESVSCKFKS